MIELNLLRNRLTRFYQRRLLIRTMIVYLTGLLFILCIVGIDYLANRMQILGVQRDIARLHKNIAGEQGTAVSRLKTYQAQMDALEGTLTFCLNEKRGRVVLARRMTAVARAMPDGMWLTRISVGQETQTAPQEGAVVGEKPPLLILEGNVAPGVNERTALAAFTENLTRNAADQFEKVTLIWTERKTVLSGTRKESMLVFKMECRLKGSDIHGHPAGTT